MDTRYIKNETMLSREENLSLREKRVAVAGCGGLGGHILEQLARLGIGSITAIDSDVFETSNLNRQLLSNVSNIGKPKVLAAEKHLKKINPDISITGIQAYIDESNAGLLLADHDVICDALDNMKTRLLLQKYAAGLGIPMVHGAIAGWYGQVATIFPGDNTLESIYQGDSDKGIEQELGNPAFTPALVASIEVSEVVKILVKKGKLLRKSFLMINTLEQEYEIFGI